MAGRVPVRAALLSLLLGVLACGPVATTSIRATPPLPLEDAAPPDSPRAYQPVAAVVVPQRPIPRDQRRSEEISIPTERRALATFPYVPRRVSCQDVARIARDAAEAAGVEAGLLIGVMRVESAFAANAISGATAVGLTQVLPWIGEKLECGDLFDPRSNALCGAKVLARWLDRFDGNLVSALSGYNAGHGMPTRARQEHRVPKNFQYVEDVLRNRARFLRRGCVAWDARTAR
jgi:soluble lytic murein transglycosylase-like protein